MSSRITNTELLYLCRQPSLTDMHPTYLKELVSRGIRDDCYDNPKIKSSVDKKIRKREKAEAAIIAQLEAKKSLTNTPPSQWSSAQQDLFAKYSGEQCYITKKWAKNKNPSDKNAIIRSTGNSGLIRRDIEIIFDSPGSFGTGMSYKGVVCIGGYIVNKSYYPGLGHTWQMTGKQWTNYLYLDGDGRERNMRVKSWN